MASIKRTKRDLTPKNWVITPENNTGKIVAMVTKNHIFPNTLPLKPAGVTSCKKVSVGIVTPIKPSPIIRTNRGSKIILRTTGI